MGMVSVADPGELLSFSSQKKNLRDAKGSEHG
jgi:hypothetical protein